jgi:prefoldin subunit 5
VFKWALAAALLISIGFCGAMDFSYSRALEERQRTIASKSAQLRPLLQPIANEIIEFQRQRTSLQRCIDAINDLKQNESSPAPVLTKLTAIDRSSVDSIAVVGNELVVNRK